ncbi:MarR family transcriptional regulator [Clostridium perfringens]|nr:MarR family transcriptional regulator [Clostridium perfringens]
MRYLHHKKQREDSGALKGNLFQINQSELAKDLGITQGRISVMINNLLDEKLLSVWYRQQSKNNGFEYNIYRLNY